MAINVYEDISQLNILGNSTNDLQTLHACVDFIYLNDRKMYHSVLNTFVRYYFLTTAEAEKKAKEWVDALLKMQKKRTLLNLNQSGFVAFDNEIMTEEEPNLNTTPNSNGSTIVSKMANNASQKMKITPNPFAVTFMFGLANSGSNFDIKYISKQSKGSLYNEATGKIVEITNNSTPLQVIKSAILKFPTSFVAGSDASVEIEVVGQGVQQAIQRSIYTN